MVTTFYIEIKEQSINIPKLLDISVAMETAIHYIKPKNSINYNIPESLVTTVAMVQHFIVKSKITGLTYLNP